MATDADRICVVIGRTRHKMVAAEIIEAVKRGARFLELRLDFISRAPDLRRLLKDRPCPMIATVRRRQDGGRWSGTEDARQMLLKHCIVGGFEWVDLENDIADSIRRFKDVKRIVSYHNMTEFPEDLEDIYADMCKQDADVLKLVVCAQAPTDNLRIINILRGAKRPTVAFCSGDLGYPSRIAALKYGSPFTYAAFNKERGVVPGMPSFDELKRVYRPGGIDADTELYGVIGDPVGHSFSPLVHNAAFRALSINARYLPFRVPRGQLPAFLDAFDALGIRGYSVTIPHKEAAAQAARAHDETVEMTRAANTLLRRQHGFFGVNTDYQAVLDCLRALLTPDAPAADLHHKQVLILGAGGMARAAAHAVHRVGGTVYVTNRDLNRAQRLAGEIAAEALDWNARHRDGCEIVINCTPVGMHPKLDETPVHASYLRPGMTVMDAVYTPETTMLIREARARGCLTITGAELFVRQAAQQFRHFTSKDAPFDLMMQVVRRALSPVSMPDEDE